MAAAVDIDDIDTCLEEAPAFDPVASGLTLHKADQWKSAGFQSMTIVIHWPLVDARKRLTPPSVTTISVKDLPLLIGSGGHCDCRLDSREVAPEQARLKRRGQAFEILPLDPNNPVFVNDLPIMGIRVLKVGDAVSIGPFTLRVEGACDPSKTADSGQLRPKPRRPRIYRPQEDRSLWGSWIE